MQDAVMRIIETGYPGATPVAFSPDGVTLATGGKGGSVQLWELGGTHGPTDLGGSKGPIQVLAFSPDGSTLAFGIDEAQILLCAVGQTASVRTLRSPAPSLASVNALTFFHGGRLLVAGL